VLLSGLLSRRTKNVIRPAIDWAVPAGFLPPRPSPGRYPLPGFPRSSRRGRRGAALAVSTPVVRVCGDIGRGGETRGSAAGHSVHGVTGTDLLTKVVTMYSCPFIADSASVLARSLALSLSFSSSRYVYLYRQRYVISAYCKC